MKKIKQEILLPYTFTLKFPQNMKIMFGPRKFEKNKGKKIKEKVIKNKSQIK